MYELKRHGQTWKMNKNLQQNRAKSIFSNDIDKVKGSSNITHDIHKTSARL